MTVAALAACGAESPAFEEPAAAVTDPVASSDPTATPDSTEATAPAATEPTTTTTPEPTAAPAPAAAAAASSTTPEETMEPTSNSAVPAVVIASGLVQAAIADLRERLADDEAEIEVVSVEEVDWPDGSIGCPQPGMVYTQALVNGTKIVLKHAGIRYNYHRGGSRDVFYCPQTVAIDK